MFKYISTRPAHRRPDAQSVSWPVNVQHQLQPRLESVDALPPLRAYFVFMLTLECIANSSSNRRLNTLPSPCSTPKSFLALNSLHLCHRTVLPLSVSLCQLCAHVTRIFAQLKSIKLHFRLNKLGPRFGCCLFHLLFPLSVAVASSCFVQCLGQLLFVYVSALGVLASIRQPPAAASAQLLLAFSYLSLYLALSLFFSVCPCLFPARL